MRRAGEGVDDAQWGTMVALKKKDESSDESEDEENDNAKDDDAEKKAEKKAKKKVDPDFLGNIFASVKSILNIRSVLIFPHGI